MKEKHCDDFLASFDYEGRPTILTAKDAGAVYGLIIDKSECIAEISNVRFQELFEHFIAERRHSRNLPDNKSRCPLLDAAEVPLDTYAYRIIKHAIPTEVK